jgi:hypothetical protein
MFPVLCDLKGSLGWAGGDLGLVSEPSADGRRMDSTSTRPKALTNLLSTLTSFGIGLGIASVLQLTVYLYWKYRANKHISNTNKWSAMVSQGSIKTFEELSKTHRAVKFKKFPIAFVFPSVFLIVFKLFVTSLSKNSATLLASPAAACDSAGKALAVVVMSGTAGFALLGWFIMIDFNFRFRQRAWKPAGKPATAGKVDDPFYRGVSLLRARCFGDHDPRSIISRSQGKFSKPKSETSEPERTERLLSRPLAFYKQNATDVLEGYQFAFFPLSAGKAGATLFFNMIVMTAQLVMAILCGIGSSGTFDESWGRAQVQGILSIQFGLCAYIWCLFPAHDRGDNLMFSAQFLFEALSTAALFAASDMVGSATSQANLRYSAFLFALGALAVPLLRRGYDGAIVQCIKMRRKGPFNKQAAFMALFLFILQLQATILKLLGIQTAEMKSAASSTAVVAKVANREVASGLRSLVDSGLQLTADAYGMLYQAPAEELDGKATKIQSCIRMFLARRRADQLRHAIGRIRALLQAAVAGRRTRRLVAAFHNVKKAEWVPPSECFGARPGFIWLQREEALALGRERIERVRTTQGKLDFAARQFSRRNEMDRIMKLLDDPWKLQVDSCRFKPKARSSRLPLPPGMPPQLLAPPTTKPMTMYALSSAAFDTSDSMERAAILVGEPIKQGQPSSRGRHGCHEQAGLVFLKSSPRPARNVVAFVDVPSSDSDAPATQTTPVVQSPSMLKTGLHFLSSTAKMILGYGFIGTLSFQDSEFPSTSTGRMMARSKKYALNRSHSALQEVSKYAGVGAGFGGLAAGLGLGLSGAERSESARRRRKDDEEDGADEEGDGDVGDDGGDGGD